MIANRKVYNATLLMEDFILSLKVGVVDKLPIRIASDIGIRDRIMIVSANSVFDTTDVRSTPVE